MNDFLILNNRKISFEEIRNGRVTVETEFEEATISFCRQWLNEQASFSLKTSGSTGAPKTIEVSRDQMLASARQTINFFYLTPDDTVLVCLNTAYIAGIMMLIRGLESGAQIIAIEPTGNPLADIDGKIDFLAIVPLQLNNILEDPTSLLKLESVGATIVGGAPVSYTLQNKLAATAARVWATFGMTETLTHFALRQLNPNHEETFTILAETIIEVDDRGCLIVTSPVTNNEVIRTNDLVDMGTANKFKWLGRIDNVINSGGVKLQIEELETKTALMLDSLNLEVNFFIGALSDASLNEKVCLLIESSNEIDDLEKTDLSKHFGKFEMPRRIAYLARFAYTPTGKINRDASLRLIDLLS